MKTIPYDCTHCQNDMGTLTLKARLHYKTQLNSTVVADKELDPKTIQSLGLGLEYTKTAVLDQATL